jgi:hypothetical protein
MLSISLYLAGYNWTGQSTNVGDIAPDNPNSRTSDKARAFLKYTFDDPVTDIKMRDGNVRRGRGGRCYRGRIGVGMGGVVQLNLVYLADMFLYST